MENFSDFSLYLRDELEKRKKIQHGYSLRKFASELSINPSFLSKLFKGQRTVTPRLINRLAQPLQLTEEQTETFRATYSLGRGPISGPYHQIFKSVPQDQFDIIKDWYHQAIMELVNVEGFSSSPQWIAKRLEISEATAADAFERLKRLQYIVPDKSNNGWKLKEKNTTTLGTVETSRALKILHKQILEKSAKALDKYSREVRDHSAMTLSISSEKFPQARKLITQFRRKFTELLQDESPRDSVYYLEISFCPVSEVKKNSHSGGQKQ